MPNVTVTQPSVINVRVGTGSIPKATEINYGGTRTLKSASDLSLTGAQDGYSIVYRANTNTFAVAPASAADVVVDVGFF